MCGILFGISKKNSINESDFKKRLQLLYHRGPDSQEVWNENGVFIGHTRLAIVGPNDGLQPIVSGCGNYILSVNGEIYNHEKMWETLEQLGYKRTLKTDCEVILPLYQEYGEKCVSMLDGIFAFVLYDKKNDKVLIARDRIGVLPLYCGFDDGEVWVSSELKCIYDKQYIRTLEPAHYVFKSIADVFQRDIEATFYDDAYWRNSSFVSDKRNIEQILTETNQVLTRAVKKRLMADVPFGVLLSGGLDSSLVASIANRIMKERGKDSIHTFSIGLEDSPDLKAAQKVADFLGTHHHVYTFTVQEGLEALEKLIWHLETYDITTIRASLPMYLLSKRIHEDGFKMVLSGEGADEILGGYLYFHKAPYFWHFHEECKTRVLGLHHFDCLRANKSTMAWSVEARVPFLDREVLDSLVHIHPVWKRGSDKRVVKHKNMEKWILREAFNDCDNPYLPDEVLWRQKEQFSDGVGYSWIDGLKEYTKNHESTQHAVEEDREAVYYKNIFYKLFTRKDTFEKLECKTWVPRTDWEGVNADPSGRAQDVHVCASSGIIKSSS